MEENNKENSIIETKENELPQNLKHWKKNITMFLISQAISLFGSSLVQYAIIWHITLQTQSGVMMTISTLAAFIPQILISVFAGVWADRYNKKYIIAISDSCIAISTLIVAICFMFGFNNIWLLFIVLAIRSFGSGIQTPTVNALIPSLIPEKQLLRINGINTTIQSIMLIISPAVAGAIMGLMPIGRIFFIDVITALIGVGILVFFVKVKHNKKENISEKVDYYKDMKEGYLYIKNHNFIKTFLSFFIYIYIAFGPISFLTPLMVSRTFGGSQTHLAINEIVFFVGSVIGGALISTWGGFKNKMHSIIFGCIAMGILSIIMGFSPNFIFFAIVMGLYGIFMTFANSPSIAIFQEVVDEEVYGRLFAIVNIIASVVMPLSMVIYGPLADIIKVEFLLIAGGIIFIIVGYRLLKNKHIKQYSDIKTTSQE